VELRGLLDLHLGAKVSTAYRAPAAGSAALELRERLERFVIAAVILGASIALTATAPVNGDFWWSDSPRHALNGAFIKDFVSAMPWHDPKAWAINYYLQYPSLTILVYPPLFNVVEAAAYSLFGVSHVVAQATVGLFTLLLATASYNIARLSFPIWSALGASLLVIGGPEAAFWARQVMLDIPAYATLVTGIFFFLGYLRAEKPAYLYLSVFATLAAVYIKINAVFIVPVLGIVLLAVEGRKAFDRHHAVAGIVGLLGLVPIVLLTAAFGEANVQSVAGRPSDLHLVSVVAWLFYAEAMPQYLGYCALTLGVGGLILVALRRTRPLEPWLAGLLVGWLIFGYIFFSAIGVREPRHGLMISFPLVLFALLVLHRFLPTRFAQVAAAALGIGTFLYGLVFCSPPVVQGYRAVADYVAEHAPRDAVVMFSGYRDGNFVFDLRTHEERRDISTIRADKLLLRIAVERERGVAQANLSEQQIATFLRNFGVSLIIAQPGFWEDLREMARFSAVLHGPEFERVAQFDITGTVARTDRSIEIYKPTYKVEKTQRALQLEMPIIGDSFRGTVGSR
jgi:hypothetical protein